MFCNCLQPYRDTVTVDHMVGIQLMLVVGSVESPGPLMCLPYIQHTSVLKK